MPRRRHTDKARHAGPVTFDEHRWWEYATRGELADAFGSNGEARESYRRREPQLRSNPGTRMESFWALFAPELRDLPAGLYTDAESWALVDRQKRGRA